MNNADNKFGIPAKKDTYKEYLGKYYISKPVGTNEPCVGKVKEIDTKQGKITLNPYFGLKYNEKSKKNLYNLINGDYDIFTDLSKISFEPTTKESILYNCYLGNKENVNKSKSKSFYERFKLAGKILFGR